MSNTLAPATAEAFMTKLTQYDSPSAWPAVNSLDVVMKFYNTLDSAEKVKVMHTPKYWSILEKYGGVENREVLANRVIQSSTNTADNTVNGVPLATLPEEGGRFDWIRRVSLRGVPEAEGAGGKSGGAA